MTDNEILIQKIKEPSKVKYILPLKNSEIEEKNLIEDFLVLLNAHPNQYIKTIVHHKTTPNISFSREKEI